MIIIKTTKDVDNINTHVNKPTKMVRRYFYLGITVKDNCDNIEEIKLRIEKARSAFMNMEKLFRFKYLKPNTLN